MQGVGFKPVPFDRRPRHPDDRQQGVWVMLDSPRAYRIRKRIHRKQKKVGFMVMKLMDIVTIVADKGIHPRVAD
jgi:hypothetical protein